jgi:hypothetical protein
MLYQSIAPKPQTKQAVNTSWRLDPKNFVRPQNKPQFEPGCVDFAASWFQSRQDVSHRFFLLLNRHFIQFKLM